MCNFALAASKISIHEVPETSPMLFNTISDAMISYDNVKLVYYVNMTHYFELLDLIDNTVKFSINMCNRLQGDICELQIERLQSQLKNVIRDNEEIRVQRKTRAICEWCGTGLHYAFGIMDAPTARNYANTINNLTDEQRDQRTVLNEAIHLIQLSTRINKQSVKTVENKLQSLEKTLLDTTNNVNRLINNLTLKNKLQDTIQLAQMEINDHFRFFMHTKGALNGKDHRIPDFIPMTQLSADVFTIAASLKNGQQLPVEILKEDPLHVFQHALVSSMLIDNLLITEITIPIVERTKYIMHKATPIPIQTPSGRLIAKIPNPYFLTNEMQTEFIPLSRKEMSHGRKMLGNTYLFKPSATIQLKSENVCAWKIMMDNSIDSALQSCNFVPLIENDLIISIIENESYFFASKKPTNIWEMCGQSTGKLITLQGRNIITLNSQCSIKSSSFLIKPHITMVFNQTATIIPPLPSSHGVMNKLFDLAQIKSIPISMPEHDQVFIQNDNEMEDLIKQSDILAVAAKHKTRTEKLIYDSQLYSFISSATIFVIITIAIIIIIFIFYRKFNIISVVLQAAGFLTGNKIPRAINIPLNDCESQLPRPTPRIPRRTQKQIEDEETIEEI